MAKTSIAVYLMLLVALSDVYETQGTFSVPLYLENFPKVGKEFEPFAFKGMMEFLGDLEGMCPGTAEFKDFFAKLKDYMACFDSASLGQKGFMVDMSEKSDKLFVAMLALKGGKSEETWNLLDGLLSMGKGLAEMNRSGPKEITFEQRRDLIADMVKWSRTIGLFAKTASENNGKSIDLSSFGIDYDTPPKRSVYETQGTFSLPLYLKNPPKMGNDVEPFAFKGMLDFLGSLESKCPATAEFKDFFSKVKDFMDCYKAASPQSKDILFEMSVKSDKVLLAMSSLDGTKAGTSVASLRIVEGILSLGKVLVETKKHGPKEITFEQRRDLVASLVNWARAIGLFVKTASAKKGHSVDLSSLGIDYASSPSFKGPSGEL